MQDILNECLEKSRKIRIRKTRTVAILLVLSLVVSLNVFWSLRQPGLTLAGDADCKIVEHCHDETCKNGESPCELPEHIHDLTCYSDDTADVESQLDWQKMFENYPFSSNLRKDLVGIAKTQVGYSESKLNFQVNSDGIRRGYTRYGAWYGTPYSDWSALFVSFCLNYAGGDPQLTPGNTGASTMMEVWKGLDKYAPPTAYKPLAGDLVFFKNNTVGIVTEVQNTTICVISGDSDDSVSGSIVAIKDSSIAGWGLTEGTFNSSTDYLLDISRGPAVFIFAGDQSVQPMRTFSLRKTRSVNDLVAYLNANGGNYFFTLIDKNNQELSKDEQGNYIVQADTGYKLTLSFSSPNGFVPGTYQYQVPNGLLVDGGEGSFVLNDGTTVGDWVVTDDGLITLNFNENMNSRTDITISATLGIHFPLQDDPIDFDGLITVTVKPPTQQEHPTVLSKWGSPNENSGKINWTVKVEGYADSRIPGSIITDRVALSDWSRPHSYSESDIAGGLAFGVSDPQGGWHTWHVSADDPRLIWDESGWSYKIPETVTCDYCGQLELGNQGWTYHINYSSTPTPLNTPGTFDYENKVTIDSQTAWGWSNFNHGEIAAEVIKNGSFVSDASGGAFLWELQVTIPGRVQGERAEYSWFISDEMRLLNENGNFIGRLQNDAHLSTVVATYNGKTIKIPRIQDATDSDMFAWDNAWTATDNGVSHTRNLNLLSRCRCTPETCRWTGCSDYWFQNDDGTWASKGFCQCWTETQNMTFTFIYKTTDLSMIEGFGSLGYQVDNHAQLFYMPDANSSVRVSYDDAAVTIPNLFEKELTRDFDGYVAHYRITVNEGKLVLTGGAPLNIHDVMTETLVYVSGSLVITAEDENGNISTLTQGVDYTVTYDGTGNHTNAQGRPVHILDIEILHPQPVMYILDYDTTLTIPSGVSEALKYSNSANITLWGDKFSDTSTEKVFADINIAAKNYKVNMYKTCALTGEPLGGATFGLFNEHGGLITTDVTDKNGKLIFQSNIIEGIILREHILYYIQELRAPQGYQLDDTKYWFCFCDIVDGHCEICDEILAGLNGSRIPFEQVGKVHIENELMDYDLPATGGPGVYPLLLVSVILIITPLVYMFIRRRKQERRGVG